MKAVIERLKRALSHLEAALHPDDKGEVDDGKVDAAIGEATDIVGPLPVAPLGGDKGLRSQKLVTGLADLSDDDLLYGVRNALSPLDPASNWKGKPWPDMVLWRNPIAGEDMRNTIDRVLAKGQVAILSSAGGMGKSTLTLGIAKAAANAAQKAVKDSFPGADAPARKAVKEAAEGRFTSAEVTEVLASKEGSNDVPRYHGVYCGLGVSAGPVVVVSYEDDPTYITSRIEWAPVDDGDKASNSDDLLRSVRVWDDPGALWVGDSAGSGPGPQWSELWAGIRAIGARLVIIDPASAAVEDVSVSETGPIRAFFRALTTAARPNPAAGWAGCGVLIVAHDTKEARNAAARGEAPGSGAVAGVAAWHDAARGVLTMSRLHGEEMRLQCVKSNYGRTGWGIDAEEEYADPVENSEDAKEQTRRFIGYKALPGRVYTRSQLELRQAAEKAEKAARGTGLTSQKQKKLNEDAGARWAEYDKSMNYTPAEAAAARGAGHGDSDGAPDAGSNGTRNPYE